jgi:hypothetical protein
MTAESAMIDVEANSNSPSPPLRWYQFRLRSLLLLAVVVAIAAGIWTSYEKIPYKEFTQGSDAVISTDRFEIVVKGAGDIGEGAGTIQVGGLGFEAGSGSAKIDRRTVWTRSYVYSFGTLSYEINGVKFSLHNHAREVVVDGRSYPIRYRAIITIDQQGNITVEDRPPEDTVGH